MQEMPGASRLIVRLGLLVLASWLLWVGFKIYPAAATRVMWLPVVFGAYLAAFGSLLGAAALRKRQEHIARLWILIATLAGVVAWFAVEVTAYYPQYRADTLALSHVAAQEMLRGGNPYALESADVIQEVERLGIPRSLLTQTTDGKPFARVVAYPALHFVVFVPALAAGVDDLRWVVLMFELLALLILWRSTPRRFQPLAFVPFLVNPDLLVIFTSGLTDWLWVTPLMLAAVSLTRGHTFLAGVAYGCATAVKQLPWVALPFLVIWLLKSRQKGASFPAAAMFLGTATMTFFAANMPFIVLDPGAWAQGVMTPLFAPLVLDGHGLSTLSRVGWLPDSQLLYGGLTAVAVLIAVAAYWRFFPWLRDALWIFPAVLMWVAYRSFHNCILYWLPPIYLWVLLDPAKRLARTQASRGAPMARPAPVSRVGLGFIGALLVVLVVSFTARIGPATSSSGPIEVRVIAVSARADPLVIDTITVEVTNRTPSPIEPVFTVMRAGQSVVWPIETGPAALAAGAAAVYGIAAPAGASGLPPRNLYAGEAGSGGEPMLLRVTARGTDAAANVWIPGF